MRVLLAVLLVAVASFGVFGFMATFEPPGYPGWRIGYGVVVALCLAGALVTLARPRRPRS